MWGYWLQSAEYSHSLRGVTGFWYSRLQDYSCTIGETVATSEGLSSGPGSYSSTRLVWQLYLQAQSQSHVTNYKHCTHNIQPTAYTVITTNTWQIAQIASTTLWALYSVHTARSAHTKIITHTGHTAHTTYNTYTALFYTIY